MTLHFNLKGIFLFCLALMFCQALSWPTLAIACVGLVLFVMYCYYRHHLALADIIFSSAFAMNLWYVLSSWGNVRQYDYFNFFMQADYFLEHNFFITNPSSYLESVFFQPPLWGGCAALVTKLIMLLGYTKEAGFDFVRFISLFCISGAAIVFLRLMNLFMFKKRICELLFALLCWAPIHGIIANLVNNDAAVYFLMMVALYLAAQWYLQANVKRALQLGGVLLAAGMIKFSGLMVVPAIGVLMIFKWIKHHKKTDVLLLMQFAIIGIGGICGFAWGFFLLWGHLSLVPPPLDANFQSMSAYLLKERLLSVETFLQPFSDVRGGDIEVNVWLTLVKTALFGEWQWASGWPAYVLYGLGILFVLICVWSFFSLFSYKLAEDYAFNAAIVVLCFSVFAAWINFWLDYPYFCSSEFRYVVILFPVSLLWIGNYFSQKNLPKNLYYLLAGGVLLMLFNRFMLYLYTI